MFVRIGKVTNVYPAEGKAQVYFEDMDSTSGKLPVLTFNNEYVMPEIDSMVVTLHLATDSSKGFILGTYWSTANPPTQGTQVYRKQLSSDSYLEVKNSELKIHAPSIVLECSEGSVSVEQIMRYMHLIGE